MPVRIRLQRHGKKGKPFYWIVAADSRAKRDGRYLEKLGIYNPNTNPATVEVDVDGAVKWLQNGAQPSDTARTLLSYRGAMMKHHLNGGVRKGAFTQEEADKKFAAWLEEKQDKIQAKIDGLDKEKAEDLSKRFEAEKAINEKRIADQAPEPVVEAADETAVEAPEGAASDEAAEETPATEENTTEETVSEAFEGAVVEAVEEAAPEQAAEETSTAEETNEEEDKKE